MWRHCNNNNNPWRYSSDETWPAEQPPLAVFPDCTRRYWVDMWSAHRIPQLHFHSSKPDRYLCIQVTTQFIRSRGWVDPVEGVFLINAFKGNIACPSIFSLRIPSRSIRDFCAFSVYRNFKASPSARCVSAANTVCWNIDIFNKDRILLMHIS
jgi:hypothetical protein